LGLITAAVVLVLLLVLLRWLVCVRSVSRGTPNRLVEEDKRGAVLLELTLTSIQKVASSSCSMVLEEPISYIFNSFKK
jgi:hypothetical protein